MKVAFGADHAGFALKQHLIAFTGSLGHEVLDLGTHGPESVDYPEFAELVSGAVLDGRADAGVVLCSNGVGISIAANKVPGIRCALCHSSWSAARARKHVDANVLAMGGLEIGPAIAEEVVQSFLGNTFEGGRHARRVGQIQEIERRGIGLPAVTG